MTSRTDDGPPNDRASHGGPPAADEPLAGRPADGHSDDGRSEDRRSDDQSATAEHELPGWMRPNTAELEGANYATLGLGFAASVALLTVGGLYLDEYLGTKPLFLLLGLVAGLVGGTVSLIRKAGAATRR
ncbi:MAG: AtpZ/AtpI family protein [Planctomycetota bacterium]